MWNSSCNVGIPTMHQQHTIFDLITAHAPISAQSSNLVVFRLKPVYFYLLYKNICCWYSFELPRQVEAIQMSTNNIRFYKESTCNIHLIRHWWSSLLIFLWSVPVSEDIFSVSTQSNNLVVFRLKPVYFYLLVVDIHLNCLDKLRQFKWIPTT